MKKQWMKKLAIALALFMAVETTAVSDVSATTPGSLESGYEVETISENTVEEESTDVPKTDAVDEGTNEETTTEDAVETLVSDATDEDTSKEEALVDYLYVEKERVGTGEEQTILVAIGDEATVIEGGSITVENIYTGECETIEAQAIDNVLLAGISYTDATKNGIYQVKEVRYQIADEITSLSMSEIGIQAYYGVNEDVILRDVETEVVSLEDAATDIVTTNNLDTASVTKDIDQALKDAYATKAITADTLSTASEVKAQKAGNIVIVLDPGHDATHAGANGNGLREEELTLKIANYCKEELEDYSGVTIYMTRSSTACPNPGTTSVNDNLARVAFAKSVGATAYVSIHLNSSTSSVSNGAAVYYPNGNYNANVGAAGKELASKIQAKLVALGLKNNGIQIRNSEDGSKYPDGSLSDYYAVIKHSKNAGFPGIIIEHAFLSNASDAANFLSSEANLKKLGVADATGIAEHYKLSKGAESGAITISDENVGKGTFKVSVGGIEAGKTVKFKVYPVDKNQYETWYTGSYKNEAYSATVDVKYHNFTPGKYMIIAYTEDATGAQSKIAKKTYEFKEPTFKGIKLSITPTSDSKKKYKASTTAMLDAAKMEMVIYNTAAKTESKETLTLSMDKNGIWSYSFAISKLKMKLGGTYKATLYAYSIFGTKSKVATASFTIPAPKTGTAKLTKQDEKKGTFELTIPNVSSDSGVKSVTVDVWSQADKSDLYTYKAKKIAENTYFVSGNIKYHDYNYGKYKTRVTVTGKNGIATISKTKGATIKAPVAEVIAKVNKSQSKTTLAANNVVTSGTVTDVKFVVVPKADKKVKVNYEAKAKSKGKWVASVTNADIGLSGTYTVTAYAKSTKKTNWFKVGTTTYEVAGPKITTAAITSKDSKAGTFVVDATGVTCEKGSVAKVEVMVWRKTSRSDMVTYKAKKKGGRYTATANIKDLGGHKGTYRVVVKATSKSGITYTTSQLKIKMSDEIDTGLYPIMGTSSVTVDQMVAYYKANATYPKDYASTDAPTIEKFCQLYATECAIEGVKAEVAFVQAMKETNFLRYGGDVSRSQFNFAGLGATGGGAKGASFLNVQTGIRAQVQHLKAYASEDPLKTVCVDGRYQYVTKGCAPYVEWLGIKENPTGKGWATDPGYGLDIVKRIAVLKTY